MLRSNQDAMSFNTSVFDYDSKRRCFSRGFNFKFPSSVFLTSHKTHRTIEFIPVGIDDPLFDSDGWDGEQQIYRASSSCPKERSITLVLYHSC